MRHLCEAYTTGGPIAILQHENLALWDGDEDYFRAINEPTSSCLQFMVDFKNTCTLCMFHQESDGNFHVYYERSTFLVLGEIFADEGFEIRHHLPSITQSVMGKTVQLNSFGGKIVVFDAAIPGSAIRLREVGCEQVPFGTVALSHRYDAALIDVNTGIWEVIELYYKDDHLSFNGGLFRLIS